MKKIMLVAGFLFCATANSANIIYYENDKKTDFLTIKSDQIIYVQFEESDEELNVQLANAMSFQFFVPSKKEAMDIIKKLFDKNNSDFIELKRS